MAPRMFERIFLDWHEPMLPAAARWLCTTRGDGDEIDLAGTIVAVTGRRAGRRLLELIVGSAAEQRLVPPLIVTAGGLSDHLLSPGLPVINELETTLARVAHLRAAPTEQIEPLAGRRPDDADFFYWLDVAEQWKSLHETLTAEGLQPADVLRQAAGLLPPEAVERWEALEAIQAAYEAELRKTGRRDRHMARCEALADDSVDDLRPIVLVGTVDLNHITRKMLESHRGHVTALVHAPTEMGNTFDAMGCLVTESWTEREIDLSRAAVQIVEGWADQPAAAIAGLAHVATAHELTLDDVTLGLGDSELEPHLQRRFAHAAIPIHRPTGAPMQGTAPCRFLHALSDWVENRHLADLATLLRHPDVASWCAAQGEEKEAVGMESPVPLLDHYLAKHLQDEAGPPWHGPDADRLHALTALIDRLAPVRLRERHGLVAWTTLLLEVLDTLYGDMPLARDAPGDHDTMQALEALAETLDQITTTAENVTDPEPLGLRDVIDLLRRNLPDATAPMESEAPAMEVLGWLELHADDAPHLLVVGFNDGKIPAARGVDPWLPNRLRAALDLPDNARRRARDSYLLTAKLCSCKSVTLIASRHGHDHEPIPPSPLLLSGNAATMATRIKHYFRRENEILDQAMVPHTGHQQRFRVPRPQPQQEAIDRLLTKVSVTKLKAYVACPYRFYLEYLENLSAPQIDEGELGPLAFGNLLHDVLCAFGASSELKTSTDPARIEAWLHHQLDDEAAARFGDLAHAAVMIQLAFARDRLSDFARWQAASTAEGWHIVETERSLTLQMDDTAMLKGRIDRIDRHETYGLRIIDYKTGDIPADPRQHRIGSGAAARWVDFQLPCYREMVVTAEITDASESIAVGYVVLPRERGAVDFIAAPWRPTDFEDAMAEVTAVIEKIRKGIFWPPAPTKSPWDPYARLCGEGIFDRQTLLDEPPASEAATP